jgi:hypothetical protein
VELQDILIGTLAQWLIKPALGVLLATSLVPLLKLPPAVGTGLILVGASRPPPFRPLLPRTLQVRSVPGDLYGIFRLGHS